MARTSTASITSVRNLTSPQRNFISREGPDPDDKDAVRVFTGRFCRQFEVETTPDRMRVFITSVRRWERRRTDNGMFAASPSPPFVRAGAYSGAIASR